ncbi:MAG: hypothetical protein EOP09_01505 [Proteobacteria bacterium]|nr:MAG: hypothetical protein EOP09_01505 [Pseudomonadota bacterium]
MKFSSWLYDSKVRGVNVAIEIAIGDYWSVGREIIDENEFQRRKVAVKGKPYQLLQRDLIDGCVMPPIILAMRQESSAKSSIAYRGYKVGESERALEEEIIEAFEQKKLLILDGLQRTFTIGDCITQLEADPIALQRFLAQKIRLEVYVGLNKMGILYRMLTLNTGQTPMSFRHQIEMLYEDYLDANSLPDIIVLREVDNSRARGPGKYKYADIVDMFYAFSTGKPESMDRQTLVGKLAELDFLDEYQTGDDDLQALLLAYNRFVRRVEHLANDWSFDAARTKSRMLEATVDRPFGRSVSTILERVQPMSAFGAECKRLIRQGQIQKVSDIDRLVERLKFCSGEPLDALDTLVLILDEAAKKATKIGTAQREIFQYSFRALLNEDSDSYLDLSACWVAGQQKFESLS